MILYINTTDNDIAEIVLAGKKDFSEQFTNIPSAEDFPNAIKKFLRRHNVKLSEVSRIAVQIGPGFFSRVRTGVVAANALAFGLKVPVVGVRGKADFKMIAKASGSGMVAPAYGAKPNISKPKKR